jgi:UDP-glucose 6-dehydrogenase
MDPRIPSYGASQHGKPFGGRCFPQNLRQFMAFCKKLNYNPALIKAVKEVNKGKS